MKQKYERDLAVRLDMGSLVCMAPLSRMQILTRCVHEWKIGISGVKKTVKNKGCEILTHTSDLCASLRFPQHQEKRVEDAIRSVRQQYEDVLERKQEEYVEKYKHLQYIEVSWSAVVIT